MRPILIAGARGTLGRAFVRICGERGLAHVATSRAELDIADARSVAFAIDRYEPWLVIDAAGFACVDRAERDPERCRRENVLGPAILAQACARGRVGLVVFSSDLVFDGARREPYDERDAPAPLGVYGRAKRDAELRVLDAYAAALVVRTCACFSPWGDDSFVTQTRRALAAGRAVAAAADVTVSPTYVPDLVHTVLDLAIDQESGVWHLANRGALTWAELAQRIAVAYGHGPEAIAPVPAAQLGWLAPRPAFSALASIRGAYLPPVEDALHRYQSEVR